jgi:hypothetical protein
MPADVMMLAHSPGQIMTDPILTGLAKRRTELLAEIKKQEAALRTLLADIGHLDATIRQFDPAYQARRPQTSLASVARGGRGGVVKTLLGILRKSDGPLTLREVTVRAMLTWGMDCADRKAVLRMMVQTGTALRRQRKNGTVVSDEGVGAALVWRVAG